MELDAAPAYSLPNSTVLTQYGSPLIRSVSPSSEAEKLDVLVGGAGWDAGSEPPTVSDNKHIVIPLMSFVFGFPILVITVLCVIQQRNKWLYERQHMRLQQQRRVSTASTVFTGFPSSRMASGSISHQKGAVVFGPSRGSIVFNGDSPNSTVCCHRDSINLQTLHQNGSSSVCGSGNSSGQRSRKQSIRFSDVDVEDGHVANGQSPFLHPNRCQLTSSQSRSPLLHVGPQNIMDKFGYVDS